MLTSEHFGRCDRHMIQFISFFRSLRKSFIQYFLTSFLHSFLHLSMLSFLHSFRHSFRHSFSQWSCIDSFTAFPDNSCSGRFISVDFISCRSVLFISILSCSRLFISFFSFYLSHSFTHSLSHSFNTSLSHTFIHALIHSSRFLSFHLISLEQISCHLIHSVIHSSIHPFIHSRIHSCIHAFIHSCLDSFIPSFTRSFISPSFIHSVIHFFHSFTRSCAHVLMHALTHWLPFLPHSLFVVSCQYTSFHSPKKRISKLVPIAGSYCGNFRIRGLTVRASAEAFSTLMCQTFACGGKRLWIVSWKNALCFTLSFQLWKDPQQPFNR